LSERPIRGCHQFVCEMLVRPLPSDDLNNKPSNKPTSLPIIPTAQDQEIRYARFANSYSYMPQKKAPLSTNSLPE
jgi:hypothetical protein